jgi:hypothetical protein
VRYELITEGDRICDFSVLLVVAVETSCNLVVAVDTSCNWLVCCCWCNPLDVLGKTPCTHLIIVEVWLGVDRLVPWFLLLTLRRFST